MGLWVAGLMRWSVITVRLTQGAVLCRVPLTSSRVDARPPTATIGRPLAEDTKERDTIDSTRKEMEHA